MESKNQSSNFFFLSILALNHLSTYFFIIFFSIKSFFHIYLSFYFVFFCNFVIDLLRYVVVGGRFKQQNILNLKETSNHGCQYAAELE